MRGHGRYVRAAACVLAVALCAQVAACSWGGGTRHETNPQVYRLGDRVPEGGGRYKIGDPYKIGGQWFRPQEDPSYDRTGVASWYGEYFHGRKTANGEWYDMNRLSAAHPTLPLPVYARVTNLQNNRSIVVRINDRGPFKHNRIIDLSYAAANQLGMVRAGTARVRVAYISNAPLEGDVADMQNIDRRGGYGSSQFWTSSIETSEPTAGEGAMGGPEIAAPPVTGSITTAPAAAASDAPTPLVPPGLYVQAASFRDQTRAVTLADELAHLGSFAVIPAEIAGDTYYRVRAGPMASMGEAEDVIGSLLAAGLAGGRVIEN